MADPSTQADVAMALDRPDPSAADHPDGSSPSAADHPGGSGPSAAPSGRRRTLLLGVRVVGIAIALLAVFLLARTLVREWPSISGSLGRANVAVLVLAFVSSAVGMFFLALLWRQCMSVFGEPRPIPRVTAWYFAGELGKYLPGGIWPVLGRGELARRGGVGRPVAYASTLVSMGMMCVGGALTCGLVAPVVAIESGHVGPEMLLLLLVPAGIVGVHPRVFGRILQIARRATRGRIDLSPPPWGKMLGLALVSVPCWVGIGSASIAISAALDFHGQPARILFAAVAAWIIGFLAIPVPAGAGIRELVFVALCGLGSADAIAVAAVARVMLVAVDGIGGVGGLWAVRRTTARQTTSSHDEK